jgi:hypothetical protein
MSLDLYDMMVLGMKYEGWFYTELDEDDAGNEDKNTLVWLYKPRGRWKMIKWFFVSATINDKKRRELSKEAAMKGEKKAFVSN